MRLEYGGNVIDYKERRDRKESSDFVHNNIQEFIKYKSHLTIPSHIHR
jgi:hypothetical protein